MDSHQTVVQASLIEVQGVSFEYLSSSDFMVVVEGHKKLEKSSFLFLLFVDLEIFWVLHWVGLLLVNRHPNALGSIPQLL